MGLVSYREGGASDRRAPEAPALKTPWTWLYGPGHPLRADKQPAATGATAGDGGRVLSSINIII